MLLALDTSGKIASAAVSDDGGVLLAQSQIRGERSHSQVILPLCKSMLETAGLTLEEITLFAVAAGPGSYTGLRIGIATVKAFAYASGKPCIGVSTLEALAYALRGGGDRLICPLMTARADLYYAALFLDTQSESEPLKRLSADAVVSASDLVQTIKERKKTALFTGDGAEIFIEQYGAALAESGDGCKLAPEPLRLQLASGVRAAAIHGESAAVSPEELQALYLQKVNITTK